MSKPMWRVSAAGVGMFTGLVWLIANLRGAAGFHDLSAWRDLAPLSGGVGLVAAVFALLVLRVPPAFRRGFFWCAGTALAALALHDLFSGPWISGKAWSPWAHGGALVAAALTLAFFIRRCGGWSRVRLGLVSLALGAAAWGLNGYVFPGHYGSFHLALWLIFSGFVGGGVALLSPRLPWRAAVVPWLVLAGLSAWFVIAPPLSSPERADLLFRRSPGARLLLGRLPAPWLGASRRGDGAFDRALEARLTAPAWVDDEALNAQFPGRDTWDLILITVDTLRPDRMGIYGREHSATPHIDAFAKKGLVFENAYAAFPSSLLGITALFTGQAPTATRFFRSGGTRGKGDGHYGEDTLTSTLSRHGFRTAATTSFPTDFLERLARHFHEDFRLRSNISLPEGEETRAVVREAVKALEMPRDGRLFLWVHLFAPHEPYRAFEDSPFGTKRPIDRYDGEIHHMDEEMAPLLDLLDRRVRQGRALVVIHSDHGEEFGEHGGSAHHSSLYEEQIHVPLVMRAPGLASGRTSSLAELMDLPATLTEWLDVPWPGTGLGRSLLPRILEGAIPKTARHPAPDVAFFQFRQPGRTNGVLDGVRRGDWKLIADRRWDLWELYDLAADPGEKKNLGPRSPSELARLRPWVETLSQLAADENGNEAPTESLSDRDALLDAYARGKPLPLADHASALAACLRGEAQAATALRREMKGAQGLDLVVDAAALFAAGDATWRDPLTDLVIGPFLPRVVDRFVLRVLVEHGGDAALLPLYTRVLKGMPAVEILPLLRLELSKADVKDAIPLIRLLMGSEDKGIRAFAADLARRQGWGASISVARDAERMLREGRQLAMRADGIPLAEKAHHSAISLMGSSDVLDWGAVFEHMYYMAALGERARAGRNLEAWVPEKLPREGLSGRMLKRASTVARTDARTPDIAIQGPRDVRHSAGAPWMVIPVTVRVAPHSRALLGGELRGVDYLVWQALDSRGAPIGNPVLHPLPVDGIMPGETRKVFLLIPGETLPSSTRRLAVLISRGTTPACSPLFVNMQK